MRANEFISSAMKPDPTGQSPAESCPWCGSLISRDKFLEIESRIREQERKRVLVAEQTVRKQFAAQISAMQAKAREETNKRLKAQAEAAERRYAEDEKRVRRALAESQDQALLRKDAEHNRKTEALQKKLKELERKLVEKTATNLGDGAEIDLFEVLRAAFPRDNFVRVEKGQPGGDIIDEVFHKEKPVGKILIDSKNRQGWQNGFVTKLREDQMAAKADHAILSTTVFPAGKKELFVEDGIVVVSPARAVHVVALLRQAIIKMHLLGLSMTERATKMARLYKFITSEEYGRLSAEAGKLADSILNLDVEEVREHERVWKKRGAIATQLKNVLRDIDTEVSAILEASLGD